VGVLKLGGGAAAGGKNGKPATPTAPQLLPGEDAFDLLADVIGDLPTAVQLEIAGALTNGAGFASLSGRARQAFVELEADLWEDDEEEDDDKTPADRPLLPGGAG